jgi:hypothetical protein
MTNTPAITKEIDPLGRLVETLKNIHIRDEPTKTVVLTDFCNKLFFGAHSRWSTYREKYTSQPPSLEDAGVNADSNRSELLLAGMRIGRQHAEAARFERELGLDFVSEEEAKMVLGIVEESQAH